MIGEYAQEINQVLANKFSSINLLISKYMKNLI